MLKKNVGTIDRVIRALIAVAAVIAYTGGVLGSFGWVLLVVAAIMAVTALVSVCPLYLLFGISTCPVKRT